MCARDFEQCGLDLPESYHGDGDPDDQPPVMYGARFLLQRAELGCRLDQFPEDQARLDEFDEDKPEHEECPGAGTDIYLSGSGQLRVLGICSRPRVDLGGGKWVGPAPMVTDITRWS